MLMVLRDPVPDFTLLIDEYFFSALYFYVPFLLFFPD